MRSYPFSWPTPIDPPDWFADLYEHEPVSHVTLPSGDTAFLVNRFRDAQRVWSDPLFSRAAAWAPEAPRYAPGMMNDRSLLSLDPPEHTRLRRQVSAVFTARTVAAMESDIDQIVTTLLDRLVAHGSGGDLVAGLCLPMPIMVICQLLGVPVADRTLFDSWAQLILAVRAASVEERQDAGRQLNKYFWSLLADKKDNPTGDLVSDLAQRDQLTDHEVVKLAQLLLVTGYTTTVHQLSIAILVLLRDPRLYRALCADPDSIPIAIEEIARLYQGGNGTFIRIATEDVEIAGVPIPAGSGVLVNTAAANRDPAVFANPTELDFTRNVHNHLGFGHGPHFCIGAPLARVELRIALRNLTRRLPELRLAVAPEEVAWSTGQIVWGPVALPVAW